MNIAEIPCTTPIRIDFTAQNKCAHIQFILLLSINNIQNEIVTVHRGIFFFSYLRFLTFGLFRVRRLFSHYKILFVFVAKLNMDLKYLLQTHVFHLHISQTMLDVSKEKNNSSNLETI